MQVELELGGLAVVVVEVESHIIVKLDCPLMMHSFRDSQKKKLVGHSGDSSSFEVATEKSRSCWPGHRRARERERRAREATVTAVVARRRTRRQLGEPRL